MCEDIIHALATSKVPALGHLKTLPEMSWRSEEDGWKTKVVGTFRINLK